jgi:hypothetical protein
MDPGSRPLRGLGRDDKFGRVDLHFGLVARARNSTSAARSCAEPMRCSGILVPAPMPAVPPYGGDIKFLRGTDGARRRRVGPWRILFERHKDRRLVVVLAVKRRRSKTY